LTNNEKCITDYIIKLMYNLVVGWKRKEEERKKGGRKGVM